MCLCCFGVSGGTTSSIVLVLITNLRAFGFFSSIPDGYPGHHTGCISPSPFELGLVLPV